MRRLTGTLLRIAGWMGLLVLFAIAMIAGLRTIAIDDADRAAVALMDRYASFGFTIDVTSDVAETRFTLNMPLARVREPAE